MCMPIVKVDKVTREVIQRYESKALAAECNGLSVGTIERMLRIGAIGNRGFYFRSESEFDPMETFECAQGLPVLVYDGANIRMFHTMKEAAAVLHYAESTLNSIAKGKYRSSMRVKYCSKPVRGFAKCL